MIDLKPIIKAYIFRWKDEIYPKEKYKLRAVNRFHQHFFCQRRYASRRAIKVVAICC